VRAKVFHLLLINDDYIIRVLCPLVGVLYVMPCPEYSAPLSPSQRKENCFLSSASLSAQISDWCAV
jgi:hypothetical protein